MDNLGFNDSTNSRKLNKSVKEKDEVEAVPLYKTPSILRWRRQRDPADCLEEDHHDDFEYMECGPSPPAESPPNIYESFEEFSTSEISVQICHDTIKMNLLEHMKSSQGRVVLLEEIDSKKTVLDNLPDAFKSATRLEINISFLWAAFVKRWDLLDGFLTLGAQLTYFEPNQGLSALHLAAFSGCIPGTQFLISRGADVNACCKCYTPIHCSAFGDSSDTAMILLNNGARVSALTSCVHNGHESVLHCAVRANAATCVRLFTAEGADVCQVEPSGMSPIHLAADRGQIQCLKIMLEVKGIELNLKTKDKEMTALHLAAEGGYCDCIELLLEKGADAKVRNHRGQTPLHLAARAQAVDCVETLLRKGNSDPNFGDGDKRTPLHAAVGKAAR